MTHALHLTTWHPCIDGVSGLFVLQQCGVLRDLGVDSGLVFSRIEGLRGFSLQRLSLGVPGFYSSAEPVRTLGFKSWNLPLGKRLVPRFNAAMLRNRYGEYVRRFGRPDVLHAHVALEAGLVTRAISLESGVPYVVTEHSSEILISELEPRRQEMARRTYADAKAVIAVSTDLAARIAEICPEAKVKVIGNMVPDAVFNMFEPRPPTSDPIKIVSIASLTKGKRIHNAVLALAQLPQPYRDAIHYTVIGNGPERRALEQLALASGVGVDFTGNMAHENAMKLLSGAHIFLHPSAFETFGVVVAEALALGVPAIATKCGGPQSILSEETGILVPVDDVDALGSALAQMLLNLDSWMSRRLSISEYCKSKFHAKSISQNIIELYQS